MNKQELKRRMHEAGFNCKAIKYASQFDKGYNNGIAYAINLLDELDEPEKPVLTKKEAEWVDKLTDFYSLPDALYYITRCGYGYLFVFEMAKKTYELPVDSGATYGEFCELKERLVNAVIYGYTVKKEKLYTAKLKLTNEYLHYDKGYKKFHHYAVHEDWANKKEEFHFTEDDLTKYNAWENEVYEVEEVEE